MKKTLLPLVLLYSLTVYSQDDYCVCEDPTSKFYALSQMMEVMQGKVAQQAETIPETFTSSLDFQPEALKPTYQTFEREIVIEKTIEPEIPIIEKQTFEIEEPIVQEVEEERPERTERFSEDADEDYVAPKGKKKSKKWAFRLKTPKRSGKYKGKCPIF